MKFFLNPRVSRIHDFSSTWRYGVAGALPYLEYQAIRNDPKSVLGYSDISGLLAAFSNLNPLNGLMLWNFQPDTLTFDYDSFFRGVTSPTTPMEYIKPI